jgi:hypothetical protein
MTVTAESLLQKARPALAAAMRRAGHPTGSVALSVHVQQSDWRDYCGILIEGEDDTRARAAAWLAAWLRSGGVDTQVAPYAIRNRGVVIGTFVRTSSHKIGE